MKGGNAMSADQLVRVKQHDFEELNKHNVAWVDEEFAPNVVWHQSQSDIKGTEAYKQFLKSTFATFPDIQFTLDDVIAQGDKVALRYTWTGTFQGKWGNIAPTGKKVSLHVHVFQRFENGKLVESWSAGDNLGLYRQMGITPP